MTGPDVFLDYVLKNNSELRQYFKKREARKKIQGSGAQKILSPKFFTESQYEFNKQESQNPLIDAEKTQTLLLRVGAQKTFLNGLTFKLGNESQAIKLNENRYLNVTNFTYTAPSDFTLYGQRPFAEMQFALGKGFNGEDLRLRTELIALEEEDDVLKIDQDVENKLNQLTLLFWTVVTKVEQQKILKSSINRVQKIGDFVRRKVNLKIEEPGSLYQVQALIKSNEASALSLQADLEDLLSVLRQEEIPFELNQLQVDVRKMDNPKIMVTEKVTKDFLLKRNDRLRESLNVLQDNLDSKATLDLYAKASYQGSDTSFGKSFESYPNIKKPLYTVGVNFLLDLDFENINRRKDASLILVSGNKALIERDLKREKDQQETLMLKLKAAYKVFEAYGELSKVQLKKLENEQRLLNLGRSSLYQILQYEQDYLRSEELFFSKLLEIKQLEIELNKYNFEISVAQ